MNKPQKRLDKISNIQIIIQKNYTKTANKLYLSVKGTKYGIRKQDFYKIYNRTKEATFFKKTEKTHRIKKDTAKVKLIKPVSQPKTYFVTKVTNKENNQKFYIVYKTQKEAKKQLTHLLKSYHKMSGGKPIEIKNLRFGSTKKHKYQVTFIAPEFRKYLMVK